MEVGEEQLLGGRREREARNNKWGKRLREGENGREREGGEETGEGRRGTTRKRKR